MVLLLVQLPLPALALILYRAGNGIHTIAPGARRSSCSCLIATRCMERLALPSLLLQDTVPWIRAELLSGDDR